MIKNTLYRPHAWYPPIPHAKADDAFYACMDTIIENPLDILLSILVLSL
jgi:hypothetical protein